MPDPNSTLTSTSRHWGRRLALALALAALAACGAKSPEDLLAEGKASLAKGDAKAAVVQFKSALQLGKDSGEARTLLGEALLASGDAPGAVLELTRALDAQQPADKVAPLLARALLLTGDYKKLTSGYGALTLKDPQANAALKSSVATAWGALGEKSKTEEAIAAALAAQPEHAPARLLQARMAAGQGRLDEALQVVNQVLAKTPSMADAWHLKGEIVLVAKNDSTAALADFNKALEVDRKFIPAHLSIISAHIRSKDLAAAKAQYEELKGVQANHPVTMLVETQLAFVDGDLKKARELSQQLLRRAPNNVTVLQLAGAVEGQAGSLVTAETHFSKALQFNPRLALARQGMAQVQLRLGQPLKALEALQPALDANANATVLALAGEAELRLNQPAKAEEYFARAAKLAPDNSQVKTALALSLLSRGDATAAFQGLERLAESSNDGFAERAAFAARMKRREYDQALKVLDGLQRKNVNPGAVDELRGQVHLARRDLRAARGSFEAAHKADAANFAAVSNLAAIDLLEKRPDDAKKRLEASVAADPRNHIARMALAEMRLQSGDSIEQVRALMAEAIQVSPTEAAPRLQLINLLLRKSQIKDALAVAQEAAAALPNDPVVLDALGRAQMESGSVEQAITTFRQIAGASSGSALPYVRLADVYRTVGKREAAESSLRKALEIEPNLAEAQAALVDLMLSAKRTKEVLDMASTLQQRRPQAIDGYALEAMVHLRNQQKDAAIATYRRALAVPDGAPDAARLLYTALIATERDAEAAKLAQDWLKRHPDDIAMEFQVASAALTRNRLEEAETRLRRVVSARPTNPLGLNNLAWVLVQRGKPGAVEYAKRAVELQPTNAAIVDTLGLALAADKQFEAALATQKKAIELAPNSRGLKLNLARIAMQSGDKALAKSELQALEKLGTTFPQHAEVKRLLSTL
jgi:putative PEP-CTERM system TPR-repeat lipoprotein